VLVSLVLGLAASLLGDACTSVVLGVLGHGAVSLAISFGTLLLLRTAIGAGCTFLGSCVDAGVFTSLYRRRVAALGIQASLPGAAEPGAARVAPPRWLPAVLLVGLLAFAAIGAWLALDAIPDERPISIHAHRGSGRKPRRTRSPPRVKQSPPARITWNWMCSFPRTTCSWSCMTAIIPGSAA